MRRLKQFAMGAALLPNIAFAHVTDAGADGFSGGLLHLLTGLDHLAALWCLGALAALMAGSPAKAPSVGWRPQWLNLPALFSLGAVAGIVAGLRGLAINPEPLVGLSVLVWGVLLVMRARVPVALQASAALVFAFFHGLAHGPVISALSAPLGFYAGLAVSFSLCFAAGFVATRYLNAATARALTGLVSVTGLSYFLAASY